MKTARLLLALALTGCFDPPEPSRIEASATASACGDTVVTREATDEERASLNESMKLHEKINKLHPQSPAPLNAPTSKVVAISNAGVIELADGRKVLLDGVLCSAEGVGYLRRVLIDPETELAFTAHSTTTPTPAEVWAVGSFEGSDAKSYSAIAETALTSGWCTPRPTETNPLNARYEMLVREFTPLRKKHEELRANNALQPTPSRCALGRG